MTKKYSTPRNFLLKKNYETCRFEINLYLRCEQMGVIMVPRTNSTCFARFSGSAFKAIILEVRNLTKSLIFIKPFSFSNKFHQKVASGASVYSHLLFQTSTIISIIRSTMAPFRRTNEIAECVMRYIVCS